MKNIFDNWKTILFILTAVAIIVFLVLMPPIGEAANEQPDKYAQTSPIADENAVVQDRLVETKNISLEPSTTSSCDEVTAKPSPTGEAESFSTPKPSKTEKAQSNISGTPKETPQSVSYAWSEWSKWMDQKACFDASDIILSELESTDSSPPVLIELGFEDCEQHREIIGEPAWLHRYKDTMIEWGGWIENTDCLSEAELNTMQNGATRFIQFQYDGSQDVPTITYYRLGDLVYLSDWSPWKSGEPPSSGGYWEQFEHEYDIIIDEANSNWTAWSEDLPNYDAMGYQSRQAMRFRWRYAAME